MNQDIKYLHISLQCRVEIRFEVNQLRGHFKLLANLLVDILEKSKTK